MTTALRHKVETAQATIRTALATARRPAMMCSFGKDSMVLLHLARSMGVDLPLVFHREPFMQRKYAFANRIMQEWNLTVYDFPPSVTAVNEKDGQVEVINYFPAGAKPCALPTRFCEPAEGEKPLCALHDFYLRPTGGFSYPWDVVLHGHKSSDMDPIYGAVPLSSDMAQAIGSVSAAFPLRLWTDADIWAYTEARGIPIHTERYEKTDAGRQERADKRDNPEFHPACTACMRIGGGSVPCPRLGGLEVNNVAAQLRRGSVTQGLNYLQTNGS